MTDDEFNKMAKELAEKDIIIKFLKRELMHKTSYRQVMKRQYRELKQKMKSDNERLTKMYVDRLNDCNKEIKNLEKQLKRKDSLLNEYDSRISLLEAGIKIAIQQLYSGGSDSEMMDRCETVLRNLQKK